VLAHGLDAKSTRVQEFVSYNPAVCRDGENVEQCERLMQEHGAGNVGRIERVACETRESTFKQKL
jgi:hypothetical protein